MKKTIHILLAMIILGGSACTKEYKNGGNSVTVVRSIDTNYTQLFIEGAFDLQFVSNQDYDIKIVCPENLLPYIISDVVDGNLYISENSNHIRTNGPRTIYVNKSILNGLRNDGSGNITGQLTHSDFLDIENNGSGNFDLAVSTTNYISINNEGSGNINIDGNTKKVIIEINGSGNINALYLPTEEGIVSIEGSGNVSINSSVSLVVNINGSGNVSYLGNPALSVNITGSGQVLPL